MITVSYVSKIYEFKNTYDVTPEIIRWRKRTTYIQTTELGLGDMCKDSMHNLKPCNFELIVEIFAKLGR